MNRRDFIRAALAAGAAAGLGSAGSGCAVIPIRPDGSPETRPIDAFLAEGARVMWCAPHPDDECFSGGILARASIYHGNPLYFMIMTHGDGGECGLSRGCEPDVATVRGAEMREAARIYRGTLQHERFFNAPLPVSSFPKRHEIYAIWKKHKDPVQVIARAMRRFRPDLVLTFHPDWGATGHPEHQLTSRCATAAVRMAADSSVPIDGLAPHRVERVYYMLNRVNLLILLGRADPGPVTETFDATLPARFGMSCVDFMAHATHAHRTQHNDMGTVRSNQSLFAELDLRQVDPFTEVSDPAEPDD
jgi:LmbE family N-acetylglucosaminyl deacetylase